MSRLSIRELVFLLLLFAIVLGQWQLVLAPRSDYRDKLLEDTQQKQQKLQQLETARAMAQDNLSQEIERLRMQIQQLKSRIPSEDEQHQMVRWLLRQAEVNNLEKDTDRKGDLVPSNAGPDDFDISEQRISLVLRGGYANIFGFMEAIENPQAQRIIEVQRLELTQLPMEKGQEEETRGRVEARLELKFFFRD